MFDLDRRQAGGKATRIDRGLGCAQVDNKQRRSTLLEKRLELVDGSRAANHHRVKFAISLREK